MEREGAALGIFLTLNDPTPRDGEGGGVYETGGRKFLKLQILTAAQVIDGKRTLVHFGHTESLKKASRDSEDRQVRLLRIRIMI